jgi:hypothetical protein
MFSADCDNDDVVFLNCLSEKMMGFQKLLAFPYFLLRFVHVRRKQHALNTLLLQHDNNVICGNFLFYIPTYLSILLTRKFCSFLSLSNTKYFIVCCRTCWKIVLVNKNIQYSHSECWHITFFSFSLV